MRKIIVLFLLASFLLAVDTLKIDISAIDNIVNPFIFGGSVSSTDWDTFYFPCDTELANLGAGLWDSDRDKPDTIYSAILLSMGTRILRLHNEEGFIKICWDSVTVSGDTIKICDTLRARFQPDWEGMIGHIRDSDTIVTDSDTLPPRYIRYGIKEFIDVCDSVNAIPFITYSKFADTLMDSARVYHDALNFIQYLNGTDHSNPYVKLRYEDRGNWDAYNVKYFEFGNDILNWGDDTDDHHFGGPWHNPPGVADTIIHLTPAQAYAAALARRYKAFELAVRSVTPDAKIGITCPAHIAFPYEYGDSCIIDTIPDTLTRDDGTIAPYGRAHSHNQIPFQWSWQVAKLQPDFIDVYGYWSGSQLTTGDTALYNDIADTLHLYDTHCDTSYEEAVAKSFFIAGVQMSHQLARIDTYITQVFAQEKIPLAITEWSTWITSGGGGIPCHRQSLAAALSTAEMLKWFTQHPNDVALAAFQEFCGGVGGWSIAGGYDKTFTGSCYPVCPNDPYGRHGANSSHPDGMEWCNDTIAITLHSPYYAFKLYNEHFGDYLSKIYHIVPSGSTWTYDSIRVRNSNDCSDRSKKDMWSRTITGIPYISANSSVKSDGTVCLVLINEDLYNSQDVVVDLKTYAPSGISYDSLKYWLVWADTARWNEWCDSNNTRAMDIFASNGVQHWDSACGTYPHRINNMITYTVTGIDTVTIDTLKYKFTLPKHSLTAIEFYPSSDTFDIVLLPGWNMVSVPVYKDIKLEDIFTMADTSIYWYNPDSAGYIVMDDSLPIPGKGYWVSVADTDTVSIVGVPINGFRVPINNGWNEIGALSYDTDWQDNYYMDNVSSDFFLYPTGLLRYDTNDDIYVNYDTLRMGNGYFIQVHGSAYLNFPSGQQDTTSTGSDDRLYRMFYEIPNPPGVEDTSNMYSTIDTAGHLLLMRECGTNNAIANAMVVIQCGDSVVIGYTNSAGRYINSLIDINDSTYIFVMKPGYVKYLIYPYGDLASSDTFQCDVHLYGDVNVTSGDTLVIMPGTQVLFEPDKDYAATGRRTAECELSAKGGHIKVIGTEQDSVYFIPAPGGSDSYQWYGLVVRDDGTCDVNYAYFDKSEGSVVGVSGPHRMYMRHCRVKGICGTLADFTDDHSDPIFQVEDVVSDARIYWIYSGDSSWAKRCTVDCKSSYSEALYARQQVDTLLLQDCVFKNYTSRGYRAYYYAKARLERCRFNANRRAFETAYSTTNTVFDSCEITTSPNDGYAIYNSGGSPFVMRDCDVDDYTTAGYYGDSDGDVGTASDLGGNCFREDGANTYDIRNISKDTLFALGNYFGDSIDVNGIVNTDSALSSCGSWSKRRAPSPSNNNGYPVPRRAYLDTPYPNPFNSAVAITYALPNDAYVKLDIFDIMGKRIKTLVSKKQEKSYWRVHWDGTDADGMAVSNGVYFIKLTMDADVFTKRVVLAK